MTAADPPQNLLAEQCVLGAMLVAPGRTVADVMDCLRPEDHYRPAHEAIHYAIIRLHEKREPIDMVTVARELERVGELARIGGAVYLHTLTETVPVAANATYYAGQVSEAAMRRRLIDAGTRVVQLAREVDDVNEAAQDAQQVVGEAAQNTDTAESGLLVGAGISDVVDWLDRAPESGASTPWMDVNYKTNGMGDGQMITVAGRPGHGKSLVAKDVALHMAEQGHPVHVATLEMTYNEYATRIIAGLAKVDLGKLLNPRIKISDPEWERVAAATQQIRDLPLNIDDRKSQTISQIRAAARQATLRLGPLRFIAIDYAQLVTPSRRLNVREQEVAQISRDVKLLAGEFSCPVMLLAQLNRGNVQRSDRTPLISDLRESGALEQDSDQVWLLHRPDQYEGGEQRLGEVDLIVGKNRNGPVPATIPLSFQGHYGRIENPHTGLRSLPG